MAEEGIDMVGLFNMFAQEKKPGEDPTMSRKEITVAFKALSIPDTIDTEKVFNEMDADNSGDIDLNEWTTCMTKELRIAIYKSLSNPDKSKGFKPLVNVAKVFDQMDVDNSGALSKEEIKNACSCLGLKAWDIDEFFVGLEVNADGEIELAEFKSNLPKFVFDAMAAKLSKDGLIDGFTKK